MPTGKQHSPGTGTSSSRMRRRGSHRRKTRNTRAKQLARLNECVNVSQKTLQPKMLNPSGQKCGGGLCPKPNSRDDSWGDLVAAQNCTICCSTIAPHKQKLTLWMRGGVYCDVTQSCGSTLVRTPIAPPLGTWPTSICSPALPTEHISCPRRFLPCAHSGPMLT